MATRRAASPHDRLLLFATALVALAALLRLTAPDGGTDPTPKPSDHPTTTTHTASRNPDKPAPSFSPRRTSQERPPWGGADPGH
jgi:hypothetical protein